VLYRSHPIHPTEADLQALLEPARLQRTEEQLTGLLLSSGGRFVQLFEGLGAVVQTLYARSQADARRTQVVAVRQGPGPRRWVADWHRAFGHIEALELPQALGAAEHHTVPMRNPHLQILLSFKEAVQEKGRGCCRTYLLA
jgi:hypothetical protein